MLCYASSESRPHRLLPASFAMAEVKTSTRTRHSAEGCLAMLQELAREGNAMGVKLSELPQINAALSAATAWAKSAASAAAPPSLRATHAKRPALALVCML